MKSLRILFALGLLWGICGSAAAELGDLYAAEVPVTDDSPQARNNGLAAAMQEVLVRLSGRADVISQSGAAALSGRASSLVQQYRYRLGGDASQRYLWAKFDKSALDSQMRAEGIPVWGRQRPRVLLWLAVESNGSRQMLNFESDAQARNALRARAEQRGMPLQLPLMDLQDQAALSAADIWSEYAAAINEASRRYPHDVILTGRLRTLGGGRWQADWTLWEADQPQNFRASGAWGEALLSGIDRGQDLLAARFAPALGSGGPERLLVRFNGIGSLAAYGRLLTLLNAQESVTRVDLRQVGEDSVLTELQVRGGRSALTRGLSLGGELFLAPQEPAFETLAPLPQPGGPVDPNQAAVDSPLPQPAQPTPADLVFNYLHGNG